MMTNKSELWGKINIYDHPSYYPQNFKDFISHLRTYKKSSLIDVGLSIIWKNLNNGKSDTSVPSKNLMTLYAYSHTVILLALGTMSDQRDKIKKKEDFFDLCLSFLNIPSPLYREFFDEEAREIEKELIKQSAQPNAIPKEHIKFEDIRELSESFYMTRMANTQNRLAFTHIGEMYRDFDIIKILDTQCKGEISNEFGRSFNFTIEEIFQCSLRFFIEARSNNGIFNLKHNTDLINKLKNGGIGINKAINFSKKIAYSENFIRLEWLEKNVYLEIDTIQKYYPDPLYTHPFIHLNRKNSESLSFLVVSPRLYFRSLRNSIFTYLFTTYSGEGDLGTHLGKSYEIYIGRILSKIFGHKNVQQISPKGDDKYADFYITLEKIDLVIETKIGIGGVMEKSILKPKGIAKLWNRLYKACQQCSSSINKSDKKVISIILIADDIIAEGIAFYEFCKNANIFQNLEINAIEITSWNIFEKFLSKNSINNLESALLDKWDNGLVEKYTPFFDLRTEKSQPSHNYEHMNNSKKVIFNIS